MNGIGDIYNPRKIVEDPLTSNLRQQVRQHEKRYTSVRATAAAWEAIANATPDATITFATAASTIRSAIGEDEDHA